MVGVDIFIINNKMLLCTVDNYSKLSIVKMGSLAADGLVQTAKMIYAEYGLSTKIGSDAGTNFTSESSAG